MRILLADDSRAMRAVYRAVLERLGHTKEHIFDARDQREVMAGLRDPGGPIDLIVFDWDLPGMDGLELMAQLKKLGLVGKVSILFSVSRQQRTLLPQVAKLGSFDSIDRPFTEEMFEVKVRSLGQAVQVKRAETGRWVKAAPPAPEPDDVMPFLLRLPSAVIDDLLKIAEERRHDAGAVLLRAGQVCDALHIVTQGEVEVLLGAGGRCLRVAGEGNPYGEFSFMMSEPSIHTVRARTPVMTASLSKARISDLLRKHPELDVHLSSLMARHKEVMTSRATTIVQSDFKGTFDTMPFANVLQVLNVGRKTGVLGMRGDDYSGGIYLENGEAVHAWTDDLKGDDAFYALSGWTKAKFAFSSMQRKEPKTLSLPTLTLLMEAMRRLEEQAPPPPAAPSEDVGLDSLFPSQ